MSELSVVVLGELNENVADLRPELSRVKAALLYGDTVLVKSHKVPVLLGRMAAKARLYPQAALERGVDKEFAEQLAVRLEAAGLNRDEMGRGLLDLLRGDDPEAFFRIGEVVSDIVRERGGMDSAAYFRTTAEISVQNYLNEKKVGEQADILAATQELIQVVGSQIVEVDTAGSQDMITSNLDDLDQVFEGCLSRAIETFTFDPLEHPLFSTGSGLMIQQADPSQSQSNSNASRAELAASMLADIPSFPTASIDEILDIRERVTPQLGRFRAAVADLEEKLNTDIGDEDFVAALDELKLRFVTPELEELRESLRDEGLGQTTSRSVPFLATGALGLGASVAIGAPDLAGAVAVSAGATTAVAKEIVQRGKFDRERKKHRLFLLFDVERRLSR